MKASRCVSLVPAALILGLASPAGLPAFALNEGASGHVSCQESDRGRLVRYERVASHPTAASVRTYFAEWIAFYQDFYQFPADIPVRFIYGFDSYKVTYYTVDAVLPGQWTARRGVTGPWERRRSRPS